MMREIVAAAALASLLVGCNDKSSPPPYIPPTSTLPTVSGSLSLQPELWQFQYSAGVPDNPRASGAGWAFDFPPDNGVHYIVTGQRVRPRNSISMTATIEADPGTVFRYDTEPSNTCVSPAKARIFLQRNGDNLSGQGPYEFYRWWSDNAAIVLDPGTATVTAQIADAGNWTSVFGQKASAHPQEFAAAINDIGAIGITFGGGCFYGHGVFVSGGAATFTLTDYSVQ